MKRMENVARMIDKNTLVWEREFSVKPEKLWDAVATKEGPEPLVQCPRHSKSKKAVALTGMAVGKAPSLKSTRPTEFGSRRTTPMRRTCFSKSKRRKTAACSSSPDKMAPTLDAQNVLCGRQTQVGDLPAGEGSGRTGPGGNRVGFLFTTNSSTHWNPTSRVSKSLCRRDFNSTTTKRTACIATCWTSGHSVEK